jgi:hypothetical protein
VAGGVAASLFVVWFAATLVAAVEDAFGKRRVRRPDVLGLIPAWAFFAPNPGIYDYRLLVRSRRSDGPTEPFEEVAPPEVLRWRAVWHPEKRVRKLIFACCEDIRRLEGDARAGVEYTIAYITLLNLVTSTIDPATTDAVQFILVRSSPRMEEPELLVRSRFHPVPG